MTMFGFEINQLADLLKETDPNKHDSDSDDDQVILKKFFFQCQQLIIVAEKKCQCTFNACEFYFSSTKKFCNN